MKRCKAEYLLIKMILLESLICKGCTFYLRLFRLACLPCIHYMHLDGYFSVIWKAVTLLILLTKNPLIYIVLLLGMRIMHQWSYIIVGKAKAAV